MGQVPTAGEDRLTEVMATTLLFNVRCRECGDVCEWEAWELEDDPKCPECGALLGRQAHMSGLDRPAKQIG